MTMVSAPAGSTTAVRPAKPLAVTGVGVVSSAGLGTGPLADSLRSGTVAGLGPADELSEEYPPQPLRMVSDTLVLDAIGRKGLRYVDRLTTLGLAACQAALAEAGAPADRAEAARTGVVIGTATGSIRSAADVAQDTLLQEKPYLVNPGRFPNTVMNSCAGQIAIRNNLHGVNATVANGTLSSLAAVRYARMAIGEGRADRLLVGGIEELSSPMAWAWHLTGTLTEEAPVGEGCAMFVLEDGAAARAAGRPVLAELLACEVGFYGAATSVRRSIAAGLAACVRRALARSEVRPEQVDRVAISGRNHLGLERAERRALSQALGTLPELVSVNDVLGECYSASGAMQLAALLATWRHSAAGGGIALVTSVGRDGNVGALVVRDVRPAN